MPRQGIAPAPQRIAASTSSPHGRGRHRLQASFRRVPGSHLPETGLQAIQLSPYRADPPAHRPVRLGTVTGFLACYFPHSPFGSRVSHQIQRHLLQSLPATRAIQQCASWRTEIAGLLGGPFPSRMQSDSEDSDAPGCVLDHGQDVGLGAVEQVDREEVAGQDGPGLGAQELRPGQPAPPPAGVDAAGLEDLPDGGRCDLNPQTGELAMNPAVPPAGVLTSQPSDQCPNAAPGSTAGQSCRPRTWRPSGGGRCRGASARSCPG